MPLRNVSTAYLAHTRDLAGNPAQQAAYDSTGHCVVLAGPGSGKTKTLVLKLARIMAEDVRAHAVPLASRTARNAHASSLAASSTSVCAKRPTCSSARSTASASDIS